MVHCYDVLGADNNYVVGGRGGKSTGGAGIGLRYGLGASSKGGEIYGLFMLFYIIVIANHYQV